MLLIKSIKEKLQSATMREHILEKEIEEREDRFKKRETEYREIIQDLNKQLTSRVMLQTHNADQNKSVLLNLHGQIVDNVNHIQTKTTNVLAEQEKDIIRFYNTKIKELQQDFEKKNEEQSRKDQEFLKKENKLISELEWIKMISDRIDTENHSLMKKYMDLKINYEAQENDRQMLLK